MKFQMPQFIDIEDKIFGPFTFKQFIYLLGGAGAAYALWQLLPSFIAIIIIVPILGLSAALTFYKVNGKPFIFTAKAWFGYAFKSKLYIWKQRKFEKKKLAEKKIDKKAELNIDHIPKLSESKLEDISWSLDVLDLKQKDK